MQSVNEVLEEIIELVPYNAENEPPVRRVRKSLRNRVHHARAFHKVDDKNKYVLNGIQHQKGLIRPVIHITELVACYEHEDEENDYTISLSSLAEFEPDEDPAVTSTVTVLHHSLYWRDVDGILNTVNSFRWKLSSLRLPSDTAHRRYH